MKPYIFRKRASEKRKLEFDLSLSLAAEDTVSSVTSAIITDSNGVDVSATMISGSPSVVSPYVYVTVQAGTLGKTYTLTLKITTTNGDIIEDSLTIEVTNVG